MDKLLLQLGIDIASNTIYDFLKSFFTNNSEVIRTKLENSLASLLNIRDANIVADKIISFLAKNGDIRIERTNIYANDSISMFSAKNTKFDLGNNSSSITKNTKIEVENDAFIHGRGGAGIKQNEDGSISFFA